ncbi:MAG: beta-galactosidase trimerization domain-containing protein [Firmicutes bacterium]|nr:beta-galactosidase trimerization domain-containing protein [Bacillota bacterium]
MNVPFRQIHMDFHTSPLIPGAGEAFDAAEFARTLQTARVESINLFAKCHHGMYYYPTKIGTMHPSLKFDLLGAQIKACREAGIRVCIYTTVVWDEDLCDRHPEWMLISPDGVLGLKKPFTADYYAWRRLCLNNGALAAHVKAELAETYALYKPDGCWIDIVSQADCICPVCLSDRKALGLDGNNPADMARHARLTEIRFMKEIFGYVKDMDPSLGVYFNGNPGEMDQAGDSALSSRLKRESNSYIDIESLPSDLWGYAHFGVSVNYLNKYAQELTMMNGKFHKAWGDFGSLRNVEALEYECFRALANGAKICIGDQLHPSGKIDGTVYQRIGEVFNSVEAKEPWCRDTRKLAQIGVYTPKGVLEAGDGAYAADATNEGVYRMMTELHLLFDFVDFQDDISGYELVVLPDSVLLPGYVSEKIKKYTESGGSLLITGKSGLSDVAGRFAADGIGALYCGEAEYCPRYMRIAEEFEGLPPMDYVAYERGARVEALPGAKVLAYTVNPYFNRTYEHFSSHRQTPPSGVTDEPCIIMNGNIIYISNPLFKDYAINGNRIYRDILSDCVRRLMPEPVVRCALPAAAELTVRMQGGTHIVHILSYIIQRKCRSMDTIEERFPLYNRKISLKTGRKPMKVYTAPQLAELSYNFAGEYVEIEIPEITGHQMIVIE